MSPTACYDANGGKIIDGSNSAYGASFTTNDVIGVAIDIDGGSVTFYKNGSSQGAISKTLAGQGTGFWAIFTVAAAGGATNSWTLNTGQRPFAYTAPSGFKALCTQNLPTPTIGATTATQAALYFDATLFTATGTTQAITNSGFQPDLVWTKVRSNVQSNYLWDSLRGADKYLSSNQTAAEGTDATFLASFNTNGFSMGTANYASGRTVVGWQWKANGSGSTNTAGSITSTVSANTTSGFSVVTFTSPASGTFTVGHGLGATPAMVILKMRSTTGNWYVWHQSLSSSTTSFLNLNSTDGVNNSYTMWPSGFSSTTFSANVGFSAIANATEVAYCFSEVSGYSKFGSYTGNGSADGPFVFTGMKPAFLLIKCSSAAENWAIYDVARDTYNVVYRELYPNSSSAETSGLTRDPPLSFDFLSNGFKLRGTNPQVNGNGNTYIYMALASNPFKYSLAR